MTQAITIIRDALEYIRVADANAPLDVNDTATALRALNQMMRGWEADGLTVGWQDVALATDDIPTPPEYDEAIGTNLAVRLAPRYGVQPDATVAGGAQNGIALIMTRLAVSNYSRCNYDDLPMGECQPIGCWRDGFYM